MNLIEKSLRYFEKTACIWGIGLVKYQHAQLLSQLLSLDVISIRIGLSKAELMEKCMNTYSNALNDFNHIKHLRGSSLSALGIINTWNQRGDTENELNMEKKEEEDSMNTSSFESEDYNSEASSESAEIKDWSLREMDPKAMRAKLDEL